MDGGVVTFVIAILIVAVLVFVAILLTGKRGYHFNVQAYQTRFLEIENKLKKDNPSSYAMTIINCDKLLDKAMIEMGGNFGSGNTEVVLEIDGREFGRAVVEQGNRENRRIGTRLVIA